MHNEPGPGGVLGEARPGIVVLAGVNGAGKSSVAGESVRDRGGAYFNPDEATKRFLETNPEMSQADANSAAWYQGKRLLQRAVSERLAFAFETTLGGATIIKLLNDAMNAGMKVHVAYVGLQTAELHIARVRARVARGGHDIPEQKIRERYDTSRQHLIALLPRLASLNVYDNSIETPPIQARPNLLPILSMESGEITHMAHPQSVPAWAKSIVMAAITIQRDSTKRQADAGQSR